MSRREWQQLFAKTIRDHGEIFEPIERMMHIFWPILFVELYTQAIFIAALVVGIFLV